MANVEVSFSVVDGEHLVTSSATPGFFALGMSKDTALRKYVDLLKATGPMPMLETRATPALPDDRSLPRGYYLGFPFDANFGDQWMYQVLEKQLPAVRFVHPQSEQDTWHRLRPKGEFEFLQLGGGTLINQKPVVFERALPFLAAEIPSFCFGTGVGEVSRWGDHLALWCELLTQFQFVGVRGPRSFERLKQDGLTNHEMVGDACLLDDVSLHIQPQSTYRRLRLWVDLSFGAQETPESTVFRYRLLRLLASLEESGRAEISLFSTWSAYDPWVRHQVAQFLPRDRPIVSLSRASRSTLQTADLCITYRLHACAAALTSGAPVLAVEYEDKCGDFLEYLNLQQYLIAPNAEGAAKLETWLTGSAADRWATELPRIHEAVRHGKECTEAAFGRFREKLESVTAARKT